MPSSSKSACDEQRTKPPTLSISFTASSVYLLLFALLTSMVDAKGITVIGGKGKGHVCADCEAPDFDPDELTYALMTLGIVTSVFLAICFCRCYPKLKAVLCVDPNDPNRSRSRKCTDTRGPPRSRGQLHHPTLKQQQLHHQQQQHYQNKALMNGQMISATNGSIYPYQIPIDQHGKMIAYPGGAHLNGNVNRYNGKYFGDHTQPPLSLPLPTQAMYPVLATTTSTTAQTAITIPTSGSHDLKSPSIVSPTMNDHSISSNNTNSVSFGNGVCHM